MNISILKDEDGIVGGFWARTLSPASLELAVETAYEYARDTAESYDMEEILSAMEKDLESKNVVRLHSGGTESWEYTVKTIY